MNDKTKQRIIDASINLFMSKGYKKTTTKAIAAAAEVNEVTVFRLFGKKQYIVEAIIKDKSMDICEIEDFFLNKVTYDIYSDLYEVSLIHYNKISKNTPLMMSLIDELGDGFTEIFSQLPKKMIALYQHYFDTLLGKDMIEDKDNLGLAKLYNNFVSGLAMSKALTKHAIIDEPVEELLSHHAKIFSHGIMK